MANEVDKIWKELVEEAKSDGVVTAEEEKLLDNIKATLSKHENAGSLKDRVEAIIKEVEESANEDNLISWDEFNILKKLKKLLSAK